MQRGCKNDHVTRLQNVLVLALELPVGVVDEDKHTGTHTVVLQEDVLAFLSLVVRHESLHHVVEQPVHGRVFRHVQHVVSVAVESRFKAATVLAGGDTVFQSPDTHLNSTVICMLCEDDI